MNIRSAQQSQFFGAKPAASKPAAEAPQGAVTDKTQGAERPPSDPARGRLDAAASSISDRVSELLESGTLTREEAAAVTEASAEFEALLERMDNALAEGGVQQDGKLQRAFNFALNALRDDVSSALSGGDDTASEGRVESIAGRATNDSSEADPADLAARLSAAFESIDSRLAGLMQERGREGGAQVAGLQDKFGDVFARLESAVAGGMNPDALGDLFERMMNGIRDGVDGAGPDQPTLYDSRSSTSPLGGASQGQRPFDATA
jgi:hypothetical protein